MKNHQHLTGENWDSSLEQLTIRGTKYNHRLISLLFFICFATWCQNILVNGLNWIHWLTTPPGAGIRQSDPFLLLQQSANWFVDCSSNICLDETEEQWIRGSSAIVIKALWQQFNCCSFINNCSYVLSGKRLLERPTGLLTVLAICSTSYFKDGE